jgi:hypothetical protein
MPKRTFSDDSNTSERVAVVVWRLAQGEALTTQQAAQLAHLGSAGAWALLSRASRAIPITLIDGVWRAVNLGGDGEPH